MTADLVDADLCAADLCNKAAAVLAAARRGGLWLATAESCTGGLIAAHLTAIAGSSDVVDRGFVTYSDAAKSDLLGVPAALIAADGAVSGTVAAAMAAGALARSGAQSRAGAAVAVTGIAGPGGATPTKPVGLVFIGLALTGRDPAVARHLFAGDRSAVRDQTVAAAFDMILAALNTH